MTAVSEVFHFQPFPAKQAVAQAFQPVLHMLSEGNINHGSWGIATMIDSPSNA